MSRTIALDLRPGDAILWDGTRHYVFAVMPAPDGRLDINVETPTGSTKALRVDADMVFARAIPAYRSDRLGSVTIPEE
jgi:hypothetical protein